MRLEHGNGRANTRAGMGGALALCAAVALTACARPVAIGEPDADPVRADLAHAVIPAPSFIEIARGPGFTIVPDTRIFVSPGEERVTRTAEFLAELIAASPETTPPVHVTADPPRAGSIHFALHDRDGALGAEGYELTIAPDGVVLVAEEAAGLFYGVQTLRHLLPAAVEYEAALPDTMRPMTLPASRIVDRPRFEWRGAMLDVSRHFAHADDVKRYIDLMAIYKLNRLHLHLSDDQGWRVEITSWPNLTAHGGSTAVGGGPGGYYTQEEYAGIVAYAQERFITVVPEIDMPGHTNAALASYPELNCDGVAPPLYTGIEVGFSALCVEEEITYTFVDDVVRELAALTPGDYFHIGGDEVEKLTDEQYRRFIERVQDIVQSHGKRMIGWVEIAPARLLPTSIVQHWRPDMSPQAAVEQGASVILSPADRVYLDMKYNPETVLGLNWAGYIEARDAYDWDPATLLEEVPESAILGVEAPLWTETLATIRDIEFMAFPRLAAVAEVGWSPRDGRSWTEFRERLGAQAPRWSALGVNFYRSPQVPWQ